VISVKSPCGSTGLLFVNDGFQGVTMNGYSPFMLILAGQRQQPHHPGDWHQNSYMNDVR
jgi:hypothetical protein